MRAYIQAVAMVAYKDERRKEELLHAGFAERLMESLRQHVAHSGVQQQGLVLAVNWGGGNKQRIARCELDRMAGTDTWKCSACFSPLLPLSWH